MNTGKSPLGSLGESKKAAKNCLTDVNPVGMFAVFGRSPNGGRAHFRYIFDKEQDAISAAQRFSADLASKGVAEFTYYVVEIKARMGIEGGKYVT
jgi:hypothetical protein